MLAESLAFVLFSGASKQICSILWSTHRRVFHRLRVLCVVLWLISPMTLTVRAEEVKAVPSVASAAEQAHQSSPTEEHQLSQKAIEIGHVLGFPITNSMLVTWIVAIGLIAFAQIATRRIRMV